MKGLDEVTSQQVVIEDLTENEILSEDLVLDSRGTHTLNSEVSDRTAYDFAVKTQPAGDQTCAFVGDSSGTVSGSEIALVLDCTPGNKLFVFFFLREISGLSGSKISFLAEIRTKTIFLLLR